MKTIKNDTTQSKGKSNETYCQRSTDDVMVFSVGVRSVLTFISSFSERKETEY